MISRKRLITAALAAVVAVPFAACDDSIGTDEATLRLLLTDAASDYIEAASVDVGRIELLSEDGPPIQLTVDGTAGFVNLLDLQDGVTQTLASVDIPAGTYHQLRLFLDEAGVRLKQEFQFNDGTRERNLFIPSAAQTGIKIDLRAAGTEPGAEGGVFISGDMVLVLDFDVKESFVIQGNPETPAGINGVIFKPTLRVAVRDESGSISGTVTTETELELEGLTVKAEPVDPNASFGQYQTETARGTIDQDGNYTIHFVVPGTYNVSVELPPDGGFVSEPVSIEVSVDAGQDVTVETFVVVAEGS